METKYLIVLSIDGLAGYDYDKIKQLPHFQSILENGSCVKAVTGVYPTETYPLHASLITGMYPDRHGIKANKMFQPERKSPDWFWFRKSIKVPTLYDYAKKAGMSVAALMWPTAGKAKIDYIFPEIVPNRWYHNIYTRLLYAGTPGFVKELLKKHGKYLKGISHYHLDNFITESASYVIKTKKPNLLLIHLLDLDYQRHRKGRDFTGVGKILEDNDRRLGLIMNACKTSGIYDKTAMIVMGDHGHMDVRHRVKLNVVLKNRGFIHLNRRGKLKTWDVFANCCNGSAQIYIKNKHGHNFKKKVEELLFALKEDSRYGIKQIFLKRDFKALRVSDSFSFILEAKDGYYFSGRLKGDEIERTKDTYKSTHGYLPQIPNYKALFLASGKGIRRNFMMPEIHIVDIAPTMAALLDLNMPGTDGSMIEQILAPERACIK